MTEPARDASVLGATAFILVVTAAWWALALWPVSGEVPRWLAATRAACFGSAPNGLPAPAGWLLLIGQPPAMLIALMLIAGRSLPEALGRLNARRWGPVATGFVPAIFLMGIVAAASRVARAEEWDRTIATTAPVTEVVEATGAAPPLGLVDQRGVTVDWPALRGRVTLVSFVFAHCTTICPVVVQELQRARHLLPDHRPAVVLVTVDPWRDTPGRLAAISQRWSLGRDDYLLSGPVDAVEAGLDRWTVGRSRDAMTGDVTHTAPVFVVDPNGTLAYRTTAVADTVAALVRRLAS